MDVKTKKYVMSSQKQWNSGKLVLDPWEQGLAANALITSVVRFTDKAIRRVVEYA